MRSESVAPGERLFRWRLFPAALRWPVLAVTVAVVALSFTSPRHSEMNVGAALVWQVWWALLPFFVLLTARTWCSVCPFPTVGDLGRRAVRVARPMPPAIVRRLGPWLAVGLLGLFGVGFLLLALETNGPETGALLLLFAAAALTFALAWHGQAWCRYACPVGLLLGLYSRLAWLRLEVRGVTREVAAAGARVCPVFSSPVSSRRAHDCIMCSACMKAPGGEAVGVRVGRPSLLAQRITPAEAMGVTILLGLLTADALRMVPWYLRYMSSVVSKLHWSYEVAVVVGVVGTVTLILLVQTALSLVGGRDGFWGRYTSLGIALLPIVLAAQLGLSSQHLLAFGEVVRNLGAEVGLLAPGHMPPADAYVLVWPAKLLQFALIAMGAAFAIRVARATDKRGRRLRVGVVLTLALGLLAIFAQPMSIAC
jgi:hypothetical protein